QAHRRLAMGMDVGGESGGSMATPNVVPLIDILLVLIIIFMVITPLIPKGLDTLVPQPSPNQQQNVELENKTVVVQIAMNGKLKINNEDTTWDGLGPRMEQIFKERAEKIAFVKGDNDVMFMDVVPLIDILLVLLVIFMIIPVYSTGLDALVPQPSTEKAPTAPREGVIVIQVLADGTLRINQEPVSWERLGNRIEEVFKLRAT